MKSKAISAVIALIYVVSAYSTSEAETAIRVALYLIFPLACIWFSEAMGSYTGGMGRGVTRATPGCFVAFGGWLLLLLPAILALLAGLRGSG